MKKTDLATAAEESYEKITEMVQEQLESDVPIAAVIAGVASALAALSIARARPGLSPRDVAAQLLDEAFDRQVH